MSLANCARILIFLSTIFLSPISLGADCNAFLCAADTNYSELYDKASEAAKKQAEAVKESLDEASAEAFKPKTSLAGSSCLDGIYGLSADLKLIDPRNAAKLDYLQILKDYIKKTACTAAVTAANGEIKAVNDKINKVGKKVSEKTSGLISFSSNTNTDGEFKVTKKVTALQDSQLMKDINNKAFEEANKKFLGSPDPYNGKNKVDITDPRYMKEGASESSEENISISADELEQGALCYFNKC